MEIICPHNECTGCFACTNICPKSCISMQCDKYGELHPVINQSLCIDCGLCRKVCPSVNPPSFNTPISCFAAFDSYKAERRLCASGGIGTLLSEFTIKEYKGKVYGTAYDNELIPKTIGVETTNDLEGLKGSKYVQSKVGHDTFRKIKSDLVNGVFVLYIATPCQIAGLMNYLKKDYNNLICVDLICHGVTPTKYFEDEISYWKRKRKFQKIDNVRFRGNDAQNFCFSLWENQKLLLSEKSYSSYYLGGFLLGVTLRENCYDCKYARPERVSDITIGDFIGLNKDAFKHDAKNVSSITVNTNKGDLFFNRMVAFYGERLKITERSYAERLEYGPSLRYPFPRHKLNAAFRETYKNNGYLFASRKILKPLVIEATIKRYLNYWTYIYRVPRKGLRLIKRYIKTKKD